MGGSACLSRKIISGSDWQAYLDKLEFKFGIKAGGNKFGKKINNNSEQYRTSSHATESQSQPRIQIPFRQRVGYSFWLWYSSLQYTK